MTVERHDLTIKIGSTNYKVKSGEITLDDNWAPYAQATLVIPTPALTSLIDPRQLKRVTLTASRTVDSSPAPAETRVFDMHIRSRVIHKDGTSTITCASDEALLQDLKSLFAWGHPGLKTVRGLINWLFGTHFKNDLKTLTPFALQAGTADAALIFSDADNLLWLAYGQSYWDLVTPFLQAQNLRLWCDEAGTWKLTVADASTPGTVTLATGDRVTDADDEINRDSDLWGDLVFVEYTKGTDFGGSAYPLPQAGPTSKVFHLKVNARSPFNQFSSPTQIEAPARRLYERLQKRGRVAPVTAVSDYSVTPGMRANIATPTTASQSGVVQAVTWRFPEASMTVTTRQLTG